MHFVSDFHSREKEQGKYQPRTQALSSRSVELGKLIVREEREGHVVIITSACQWCSPGMLTTGALQKCPELAGGGGGGVQYDILEILNFVGVYSSGTNIRHYSY